MARNSLPSSSDPRNPFGGDRGITPVTDIKPRSINREEAAAYWLDTCGLEIPPPEPWNPVRPRVGWVVGEPSRSTYPFLNTVRDFCLVPKDVVFRLPRDGERADLPPRGWFTLYKAQLYCAAACGFPCRRSWWRF
ncbi:unnamed protein product [Brassica oleracea var. botrytis]|uniref:(rape) hypothetical protein n=1 Tax=Brassica napus TaxID=3708 RepID=A0A816UB45_BRANA|nr:unnamed protein product [Brassica napus]